MANVSGHTTLALYQVPPVVIDDKTPTKPQGDGTAGPIGLGDYTLPFCPSAVPASDADQPGSSSGDTASAHGGEAAPATATAAGTSKAATANATPSKGSSAASSSVPAARAQPQTATRNAQAALDSQKGDRAPSSNGAASAYSASAATPPTTVAAFGSASASTGHTFSAADISDCKDVNAYKASIADGTGGMRNRLLGVLIARSDLICSQAEAKITGTNDLLNFSLGETTTILAGAGALVTGLTPARILAGTASITNATRSQVNAVFYENALKAAVIQKIDSLRATKLTNIQASAVDQSGKPAPLTKFSTEDMLNAVVQYHNECSFYAGITNLTQVGATVGQTDVSAITTAVKTAIQSTTNPAPAPTPPPATDGTAAPK